jgi:hypothetical protein
LGGAPPMASEQPYQHRVWRCHNADRSSCCHSLDLLCIALSLYHLALSIRKRLSHVLIHGPIAGDIAARRVCTYANPAHHTGPRSPASRLPVTQFNNHFEMTIGRAIASTGVSASRFRC